MTKDVEREALVAEIELFIAKAMKAYVVESWADSYQNTSPFAHVINDRNEVWWMKTQAHQLWQFWQAAKAKAVQEGFVSVEDKLPIDGQDVIAFDAIKHCVFKGGEFLQGYIEDAAVNAVRGGK